MLSLLGKENKDLLLFKISAIKTTHLCDKISWNHQNTLHPAAAGAIAAARFSRLEPNCRVCDGRTDALKGTES